jgi:hypothetical protein
MEVQFKIKPKGGVAETVTAELVDVIAWEEKYQRPSTELGGDNIFARDFVWLAWHAQHRTGKTTHGVHGLGRYPRGHRRYRVGPFRALGESSSHWLIASLAVETGIAPSVLVLQSERMLWTMLGYIRWRSVHSQRQ